MAAAKAKNELAVVDNFDLQTISGDLAQAIAEEMDGLGALPFDRVKIPSGGGLAFELLPWCYILLLFMRPAS